ncbi:uncharacterized protein [Rutidosis leptorrhynchoides]|uniref:uncharacterized protein n=1 Tax=Rutidosis leptorrhynchoides TaxID=125765 RepID=UPI003A9A62A6
MEQASPIVRCCNNINNRRKRKEAISDHNPMDNTDIHNPLKNMETSGGFSIYHHKKQKKQTRVISTKIIMGGDELPVDSIYNILSRMPVKSLARFQCVSKVWCKYINDPYLEIMHAKRAMKDPTMLIMVQLDRFPKYPYTLLSMLVTKEEEEESAAAGGSTHDEVVITTKDPPYMEFCSKDWGSRFIVQDIILGSCKGLMISSQDHLNPPHNNNNNVDDDTTVLLVINPLKKECYKLPPIKIWSCTSLHHEREACGLGFDESTNTYKMVCVVLRNQENMISRDYDDDVVKEDLCTMIYVLGTDSSSS